MSNPFRHSNPGSSSGDGKTSLDKQILNMTQQYLSNLSIGKDNLSYNDVSNYIYQTDPSLKRKPTKNVKKAIENAINTIRNTVKLQEDSDSIGEDDGNLELMQVQDTNSMNKSLLNMYKNRETVNNSTSEPVDVEKKRLAEESETPKPKRVKVKKDISSKWPSPKARLSDVGGIDHIQQDLVNLVLMPFRHIEIHLHLGIKPPRGVLLHGPPGCGKTLLANAIAGELGVPFLSISAPSVVSGMSGESEKKIREIFDEAKELAPCLLFIDEIDAITPKRETAQREMERRIVAQLLTCMDELTLENTNNRPVLLLGATNRPDSLDPALRRAGRFDREISMGVPDDEGRAKILQVLCSKLRLAPDFDYTRLVKVTPGYVGADLHALTAEAGMIAVQRIYSDLIQSDKMDIDTDLISQFLQHSQPLTEQDLENLYITSDDFMQALKKVQPSSKREGFATVPDVTWEDIGALATVRDELRMAVVEPIRHPELFKMVGITAPMGVLLYGPPGCGKTLLAKAVANESHSNFLSVKGPELLNKYVGESERAIRQVFSRAAASAPCVIFFDELDALAPTRSNESDSTSGARLVNTLLTELDGLSGRKNVFVIAATNRPDMIDPAMIRPGRLDRLLYVDLPSPAERLEILKTLTRKTPLAEDIDLNLIANDERCNGFSGADLSALVREAAVTALRSLVPRMDDVNVPQHLTVTMQHFNQALNNVFPSVSKKDYRTYQSMSKRLSGIRSRLTAPEGIDNQ